MSTLESMTDEELALSYINGNNRAFDELLSRSQDKIFNYIMYIVKDENLANDLFQEKRILQARLNIFLAMLCLGYYGILFMYVWFAQQNLGVEWNLYFWSCIPLICFVLTLMATRRILKDEALVRAADRIR